MTKNEGAITKRVVSKVSKMFGEDVVENKPAYPAMESEI